MGSTSCAVLALAALLLAALLPANAGYRNRPSRRNYNKAAASERPQAASFLRPELVESCQRDDTIRRIYEGNLLGGCGLPTVDGFPSSLPEELLRAGVVHVGGERSARLAEKLRAGLPISVLALGGSVTVLYGGCWNHEHCPSGALEPGRPLHREFLARFMNYVNVTYPHRDHTLHNNAVGAAGASRPLSCPAMFLREDADLVIMDHAVNSWHTPDVKALLALVMRLPKKPAVVLLNMHFWGGKPILRIRAWNLWMPATREALQEQWKTPGPDETNELKAEALAAEYGLGSVSYYRALIPLITGGDWPPPAAIWPLERHFTDNVHWEKENSWMSIYNGDALIGWLRKAAAPGPGKTDLSGHGMDAMPPVNPSRGVLACFGWPSNGPQQQLGGAGGQESAFSMPQLSTHNLGGTGVLVPQRYRDNPNITNTWFIVPGPIDGPPHVRMRSKPGIASVTPGAVARLELPVPRELLGNGGRVTAITIAYLMSYMNTGLLKVECVMGCSCEALQLDTLSKTKYSGEKNHQFAVSVEGDGCTLQLTNLPREKDGGSSNTKVKVMFLNFLGSQGKRRGARR